MTDPKTDPKVTRSADKVVDAAADAIKTAAKSQDTADAEAKQEKAAKEAEGNEPTAYTSTSPVYVDNRYYKAGEVFVTKQPKGDNWTKQTPAEVAAIEATDKVPDDASLEEATKSALQAVAIIRHVNIVGLDKQGLIDAIKAANEPKL